MSASVPPRGVRLFALQPLSDHPQFLTCDLHRGGMSSEATHCDNFSSMGKSTQLSLTAGNYLVAGIGNTTATVQIPVSISAVVIVLGDNSPSLKTENSTNLSLDENGVAWN